MSEHYFLDVELKLQDDTAAVLTAAYFQGSIENSMQSLFGEIGGQTELELVEFDCRAKRGIVKVPRDYCGRLRAAITLIGRFQDIPCHFRVNNVSKEALSF